MMRAIFFTLVAFSLLSCGEPVPKDNNARILAMGDSLLAWNQTSGRSISHAVEFFLQEPVVDRSVVGAQIIYDLPISGAAGLNISKQYVSGPWDWIVLSGGGNDMWLGCGCNRCAPRMERLISRDSTRGEIPRLIAKLRNTGAQVVYVGYLRSPGVGSPIEHCRDEGDELERRIAAFTARDRGVYFVSNATLVPNGDRSFHALDMIHPSKRASAVIGQRIARIIGR